MCDFSRVLEEEYEEIEDSKNFLTMATILSTAVAIASGIFCYRARVAYHTTFNCWIFATTVSSLAAIGSVIWLAVTNKQRRNAWINILDTGCATANDPRHRRFRTQPRQLQYQQQQYYDPRYEYAQQPMTQNSLDVSNLVRDYARGSKELRLTANGIQIIRDDQPSYVDAEYIGDDTPRFQRNQQRALPPVSAERAIVRRQPDGTKVQRRER